MSGKLFLEESVAQQLKFHAEMSERERDDRRRLIAELDQLIERRKTIETRLNKLNRKINERIDL